MSPSSLGRWLLLVSTDREGKARQRPVACGAVGKAGKAEEEGGGFLKTLQLGAFFGLWYLFNIYFNIYNKQVSEWKWTNYDAVNLGGRALLI